MVRIPKSDECCREDVDTSGYKGKFIDVSAGEEGIDEKEIEEEKELVV